MTEAVKDVGPKYWGDVLASFGNGVQLDLRVKLAVEFLKSPAFEGCGRLPAQDIPYCAAKAIDLASALLEEAAARGLLKDMPDTGEISQPMRHHIERSVRAQVHSGMTQQRVIREETGGVMPAGASVLHPAMNG